MFDNGNLDPIVDSAQQLTIQLVLLVHVVTIIFGQADISRIWAG